MATHGLPARTPKNVQDPETGMWYSSPESMAKHKGAATPRRDAAKARQRQQATKFLGLSALDALRKISS